MAPEKTLEDAIRAFGGRAQLVVAVEELSELQKEICKYLRGFERRAELCEEMADVRIMLDQLEVLFDCREEVEAERRKKLERLRARLQEMEQ